MAARVAAFFAAILRQISLCFRNRVTMEFVSSNCGFDKLSFEGYVYLKHSFVDEKVIWRCENRTICKARLHIEDNESVNRVGEHTQSTCVIYKDACKCIK